ncbi:dnaJ homolog subfamily B member 13 isoform X1 [Periophthalmus magnuspinnatus]|uniref:dnaJ homolog subfamily B member 13 isoform X1 n=1 Tax=Periophthalmus magnuspinnatus TaxID=409849 RepID=UPI00145AF725|nr:dnaJ homolog subfamily B member 13 isoform X1 [Periophthalmus magnuspinnatus]
MGQDYYEILEINRNATDADIKKAYRRLARKFHPASNKEPGSYEKFRQLGEALDVLSDLHKKATYDKFGEDGLKGGIPIEFSKDGAWSTKYAYHDNPEKTFKEFFGSDNPFSDFYISDFPLQFGGLTPGENKIKDDPIERYLYLSLDDLYHGCTKKIKISRKVMNIDGCTSSIRDKILTVTVKPGWKEGTRITFPEEGDQGPNNIAADIVFIVQQKPHPVFERIDNDLIYHAQVSLEMALTGFSVEVETLDGRLINIPFNEIVHPLYKKVVPKEGMPLPDDPSQKGDLIFTFDIHFPEKLSAESKLLIKQALHY